MSLAMTDTQTHPVPVVDEETTTRLNAAEVWPFIEGQANLHGVGIAGSLATFQEHLKQDKQRVTTRPDAIRLLNCRIYTLDDEPAGYALYNPAFDSKGNFGFYMEDVFVAESARRHGLGRTIWARISKRALQENATFIKWVTDGRNETMKKFAEKHLYAVKPDEENLDGTPLLAANSTLNEDYLKRFETRAITIYDAAVLKELGMEEPEELAQKSHNRLPLVGFITREQSSPNTVVAATVAYLNYSTFKTCWGVNIEPTHFKHNVHNSQRLEILHSTIDAVRNFKISATEFNKYANGSTPPAPKIQFIKWHAANGTPETLSLKQDFGLEADKMADTDRSTMILYLMGSDAVRRVSQLAPLAP